MTETLGSKEKIDEAIHEDLRRAADATRLHSVSRDDPRARRRRRFARRGAVRYSPSHPR